MLHLYRRHLQTCPQGSRGRQFKRCKCPVWIDGYLDSRRVHKTANTTTWESARELADTWEAQGYAGDPKPVGGNTPALACAQYLADAESRNLKPASLKKHRVLLEQFQAFCAERGIDDLRKLTLPLTREFRQSWKDSPISASKKLERLRSFLRFCQASGWCENHAKAIKAPIETQPPTLPFTTDELSRILEFCNDRMKALVLLLRYSGLRITDAASLAKERIQSRRLFLYTQKTGVPISVMLPQAVIDALDRVESKSQRYWFWSGTGKLETLAGNMRRSFRRIAKLAKVAGAHPHRLRDTFAVESLNAGTPIELVSRALGHKSVKITEKHYSPWVVSRQEHLDALLEKAHANDPLLFVVEPAKLHRVK